MPNHALDQSKNEEPVPLEPKSELPLVALAFKLEESRFGQLTYTRVYQGVLRRGDFIYSNGKKIKVPRLVRMHSNEMEEIEEAGPGEIVAMFGVDCASGTTFTDGSVDYTMSSMFVPAPVMSIAITPKNSSDNGKFSKALNRFSKEDPTFRISFDDESKETIIYGMGELHLQIYQERLHREYGVETVSSPPRVNYREAISGPVEFDYLHKKQSGGAGQFGRVIGVMEPLPDDAKEGKNFASSLCTVQIVFSRNYVQILSSLTNLSVTTFLLTMSPPLRKGSKRLQRKVF